MKIGIVGCGMISGHHLTAATRYPGAEVIALVDQDIARARAQAARFSVKRGLVSEIAATLRKKEPTTNRHRIKTKLARVRWDSAKVRHVLKWRSRMPLRNGLTTVFRDYASARMKGG